MSLNDIVLYNVVIDVHITIMILCNRHNVNDIILIPITDDNCTVAD